MVYQDLNDLPEAIRDRLPSHAQHIYLSAFNNAWEEYKNPSERYGSLEEAAHRVAWAAVKKKYTKTNENQWKRKT